MLHTLTNVLTRHMSKRCSCASALQFIFKHLLSGFVVIPASFLHHLEHLRTVFSHRLWCKTWAEASFPLAPPQLLSLSNQIRQIAGVCTVVVSSCPSFLRYKWIYLPLNLQLVSILGKIADTSWTQPGFKKSVSVWVSSVWLTHILHFKESEVCCLPLASITTCWALGGKSKKDTAKRNKKRDRVQLRHTSFRLLPLSVLTSCHQGDIAQGAPVLYHIWRPGLASVPLIIAEAVMSTWKTLFYFVPHDLN